MLVVRTSTNAAIMPSVTLLARMLEFIEPRLLAQAGTATGALTLDDGTIVSLSGTVSGTQLQLSGEGGYSVTATASGGALSGTVSTPQGSFALAPVGAGAPYAPPTASPVGIYEGTYSMRASGYFRNVVLSSGFVERNCGFDVVVSGTMRVEVIGPDPTAPGMYQMHWSDDWRESSTVTRPCSGDMGPFNGFATVVTTPRGPLGVDMPRDPANIQFTAVDQGDHDGGTGRRTFAFVGVLNGATIPARLFKSSRFAGRPVPNNEHSEGYPPTEVGVTLVKR